MPRGGFKSITLSESVYDNFYTHYEKNKEKVKMKGVFSFSGFITLKLNEILTKEEGG